MSVSTLFRQTPAERNAAMREAGQPRHLGPERPWAIEGYALELRRQNHRTPTHRGEPRNA